MNLALGTKWKWFVSAAVVALTAFFFSIVLVRQWHSIQHLSIRPDLNAVAGTLCFFLTVLLSALLWGRILGKLPDGLRISTREAVQVGFAAWILKYIPGQVGGLVYRLRWGLGRGLTAETVTTAVVLENVFLVAASTVPTLPIVLASLGSVPPSTQVVAFLLGVLLLFAFGFGRSQLAHLVKHLLTRKRPDIGTRADILPGAAFWQLLVWFVAARALNGAGFVFIAKSLFEVTPAMYLTLAASYILAGIIGMLAVFVPGGLGVREGVIVGLLAPQLGLGQAVVLSVASRFYTVVADLIVGLGYIALKRWGFSHQ